MRTKEHSTVESVQLCFIEPMYASIVRELPDGDAWAYEAKLDHDCSRRVVFQEA
jgi:hypothetical protein